MWSHEADIQLASGSTCIEVIASTQIPARPFYQADQHIIDKADSQHEDLMDLGKDWTFPTYGKSQTRPGDLP